ncbi:mucin-binding protein [Lactobacillus kefiranofaciens]|uniref:mucin-binding protein n=1 Tax=Lactobacillus kefiranofaciens TaxID=267818 RepID=UPI0004688997|nr:MucBP domain-containing protein [Lactobacillus kefiranofaciens]
MAFSDNPVFNDIPDQTQIFKVTFRHGQTTVTPEKPGKPGQPINPNNPDGPKYPTGTGINDLEKSGKQIIHYVGAGEKTPKDNQQDTTFTRKITFDNVTEKIIDSGTWTPASHQFTVVNTPVVQGYVADVKAAGGFKATPADPEKTYIVTYQKIGKIIPVDQNDKPIPNAPTPEYKNDPNDPTKVIPDEDIPTVPGYEPKNPGQKVTPTNPTKDTEVPYVQNVVEGKIVVDYIDSDDHDAILATKTLTGKMGEKITYTTSAEIRNLTNKGYVLVKDGFTDSHDHSEFTKENDNQVYQVIFKHGTIDVTPENPGKPGQPINSNDPNGPKYPNDTGENSLKVVGRQIIKYVGAGANTPKDITTETTFTRHFVIDKVTGQIINKDTAWTPASHTFDVHQTPVVKGYVADAKEAGGFKATPADPEKTYTVTYKQVGKIVPVGPNGQPIPGAEQTPYKNDPDDPTSEFTKENDNHVYQVIFKHGLQPVNPDHPGKPGQPINPNDPDGPKYPTGSNEVTKTVTRTIDYVDNKGKTLHAPVVQTAHFTGAGVLDKVTGEWQTPIAWTGDGKLAGVASPEIAGYHIVRVSQDSSNNVNVAPVTVNEATKDYDVVVTYELNPTKPVIVAATGSVTYYDQTTKQDLKVVDLKGNVGEKITYTTQPTIDDYLNKGYKLVSSNFKDGAESFKKSGNKFTVVLEHGTIDVTPENPASQVSQLILMIQMALSILMILARIA